MRNAIILALGVVLLLIEVGLLHYQLATSNTPCLLPSTDAGFVEQSPVRCVNTGLLATSKEIAMGDYYQGECQSDMPVPCAMMYLVLFEHGKATSKVLTNQPQVADYFIRQGFVPVPEDVYNSIEL